MAKVKTTAAVTLLVLVFGLVGRMDKEDEQRRYVPISQEDDPFWDCSTMGNYSCNWPIHGTFPPR